MVRGAHPASSAVYNSELEMQAQDWIEKITGEPFEGDFAEELRDGRRLCNLINLIKPGSVRRVNNSKMPFKQMENTSNFLKACRTMGVPEYSLFETVDLFELKDIGLVVKCLHALGGTVQLTCPEFQGPHLGLKPAPRTSPKKTSPAKAKTWGTPSRTAQGAGPVSAPSWRAAASVLATSQPASVKVAETTQAPPEASPSPTEPSPTSPPPPPFRVSSSPSDSDDDATALPPPPFDDSAARWSPGVSESQPEPLSDHGRSPPPAYRDPAEDGPSKMPSECAYVDATPDGLSPRFAEAVHVADDDLDNANANNDSAAAATATAATAAPAAQSPHATSYSRGRPVSPARDAVSVATSEREAPALSVKSASPPPSDSASMSPTRSTGQPAGGRGGGYGLDAELVAKREANYDFDSEREAQEWVEAVTGEPFADEFGEELRNGKRLCVLINAIKPGAVRKVNDSRMPFKQMENVSNFLKACRAVGVAEYSLFETVDLFEGKDLGLVVRCLHALGQTVQKSCPDYDGPRLGVKLSDSNKREWTVEQQRQQVAKSQSAMTGLMAGSSKTMERGAIIKEGVTFGASTSGTGCSAVPTRWGMGSQATMERTTITKSGPTFGADYAGTGDVNSSSSKFTRGYM